MKLPQLSVRDLFWLVALVAMGCGWWVREWQLQARLDYILKVYHWPVKPGDKLEIIMREDGLKTTTFTGNNP